VVSTSTTASPALFVEDAGTDAGTVSVGTFLKTGGNEFLAHDIIRHTVTPEDDSMNYLTESWNKATKAKIASISTVVLQYGGDLHSGAYNDYGNYLNYVLYNGSTITVEDHGDTGGGYWQADDIVTIYIVYEK